MKTPTWATTIAILMIVFGGCSIMNDFKAVTMPSDIEKARLEMNKKMDEKKHAMDSAAVSADSLDIQEAKEFEEGRKKAEEILNIPEFSKTWIVRFGYIGLLAALIYIAAGILLLVKKRYISIQIVYAALAFSILTSGAQLAVLTSSSSSGWIALGTGLGQLVGIIIDIILLAVIFTNDKEAYKTQ